MSAGSSSEGFSTFLTGLHAFAAVADLQRVTMAFGDLAGVGFLDDRGDADDLVQFHQVADDLEGLQVERDREVADDDRRADGDCPCCPGRPGCRWRRGG
jgi:hypothetical protein